VFSVFFLVDFFSSLVRDVSAGASIHVCGTIGLEKSDLNTIIIVLRTAALLAKHRVQYDQLL